MGEEDLEGAVKAAENGGSVLVETSNDLISKKEEEKGEVKEIGEDKCDVIFERETVAEEPIAKGEKETIEEIVDEKKQLEGTEYVKESEDLKEEEKEDLKAVATEEVSESKENDKAVEKKDIVTKFEGGDTEEAVPMEETVTETTVVECVTTETVEVVNVIEIERETKEIVMEESKSVPENDEGTMIEKPKANETAETKRSDDMEEQGKEESRALPMEEESESKETEEIKSNELKETRETEESEDMQEDEKKEPIAEVIEKEPEFKEKKEATEKEETKENEEARTEIMEEDSEPKEIEEVVDRVEPGKQVMAKEGELKEADEVKEKGESKVEAEEKDECIQEVEAKETEENNEEVKAKEKEENKDEVEAEEKEESKEDMEAQEKEDSKEVVEAQEKEDIKEELEAKEEESKEEVEAEKEECHEDMEVEEKEESKDHMEVQEKEETEEKVHDKVEGTEANNKPKKSKGKKRSRSRSAGKSNVRVLNDKTEDVKLKKELEPKTPVAYVNDRPVRERKSVERLVAVIENDSSRELHIRKGRGTALKDIPNVSYKISRVKNDDIFKLLHTVLYGRRGKAIQVKHNVSQFSGFVWHGDEEKHRLKIKEKLDRFPKEKLLEFCDLLDIPIAKASSIRKEDVLLKLIDFLEAPNATTDVVLEEKEQGSKGSSKRKRPVKQNSSSGATPSKDSAKRQRKMVEASKEEAKSPVGTDDESDKDDKIEEENEKDVQDQFEDEKHSSSDEKENESEEGSEEERKKRKRSSSSGKKESVGKNKAQELPTTKKRSTPPAKVTPKKSHPNSSKVDDDESPKVFSRKSKDVKIAKEAPSTPKSAPKEKSGKSISKGKETPSNSELRDTICEILKEVDFTTATFTDILQRLGKKYKKDLASRKASIKQMIQEELTKLADEADDDEEEEHGDSDGEKNEVQPADHEVKA